MEAQDHRPLKYPHHWRERRKQKIPISIITCYDAAMAKLAAASGVDAVLVGDTLGMTVQGRRSTLPVTVDQIIYHSAMVRRGAPELFVIADMPFGSYQTGTRKGVSNAVRILQESEASAIKLEGAAKQTLRVVERCIITGIPVIGHIGLTPQSFLTLGGYRVQGRSAEERSRLVEEARALQSAGAFALVLELIARDAAREITEALDIPTIGIGAGPHCSGQVLVLQDMLALDPDFHTRHSRRYLEAGALIQDALRRYADEVRTGQFPGTENSFQ
ncbi:MAG: 3-methyl-2-oxobutanoate hydroxymethyltransferase [Leptospirales bacterium]|nr:3-methyl-2-oxobutanoate hydroxymethyltransferase [Leptospirales bacterium]